MTAARSQAGYSHPDYAEVFRSHGTPRRLGASGGTILVRPVPGTELRDAMGCYPLFCCTDWHALRDDFEDVGRELVSLVLVTDPFAPLGEKGLRGIFGHVIPFKTHFIADLSRPAEEIVSPSRYRAASKVIDRVEIEIVTPPGDAADDWLMLQAELIGMYGMAGIKVLDRNAVARLLRVPGTVVFRAGSEGRPLGMHIEFVDGDIVYGHLAAYSRQGRKMGVAGAIHLWEIRYFAGKAAFIDWGGESGLQPGYLGGLAYFKQGFSNTEKICYLCGRIFDSAAYRALSRNAGSTTYFPAYRAGELA